MTTWINKEKFKDENFSVKEGFATNHTSNPLEQFLKSNPLKSVFEIEPVDSRVESFDPITSVNPIDDQEIEDNINPFGIPNVETEIKNKSKKKRTREDIKHDNKLIDNIMVSLFSLFITIYVSYNWYFNFTEGFSKRIQFYEKFDVVNYVYFFSEYFYKIVRFFDETTTIRIPEIIKLAKESFFKERSIFVLIFFISHFFVKSVISFLKRIYKYTKTFIQTGKINIMKLISDPKSNNIFVILLFVFFVLEGIMSSLKGGIMDKMDPTKAMDPSESFKSSLNSFKVANPVYYFILILIRVAIVYYMTVPVVSALILIYFMFYALFGIVYYKYFNGDPIDEANLYYGVRDESFLEMFRRIHAVMNVNQVIFEYTEERGIKYWTEWFLRNIFNNLPFLIMFFGLFRTIPSVLKIYSPTLKMTGIALISGLSIAVIKFMLDENPKMYILQQKLLNSINGIVAEVLQSQKL